VIVVDATVVADLLLAKGRLKESAGKLLVEDPEWISTALWRYEFGNVMLKIHRHGEEPIEDPERRLDLAGGMILEAVFDVVWGEVWSVADQDHLSYYDASYVWLARSRGLKVRTRDTEMLRNCPDVAEPMPEV